MQPTLEEKKHILELVQELKGYVQNMHHLMKYSIPERVKVANRMIAIKEELKRFREAYPDA